MSFGPDGYLYIGMGDGGSANDPENRAQNRQELLGKILRIDVDDVDPGKPYASPPTNPFAGTTDGRDEIYALGLRNPWRFSFDRATGRLYAGDVGQGQAEEIDIIEPGGNYGWRVFEGTRCTNLGPFQCDASLFVPPVAEYRHEGGRCSVTGGYVYRGTKGSLPSGSYVFADYCSGEIFVLGSAGPALLLDTNLAVSSFGEDEEGEIYVAGLNEGTVYRIVNPEASATSVLNFPMLSARSDEQPRYTGVAVANMDSFATDSVFTAYDSSGALLTGSGITNPRTLTLGPAQQRAMVDAEIWGPGFTAAARQGWFRVESAGRLAGFFLAFDAGPDTMDGAEAGAATQSSFVFPEIEDQGFTRIHVANPGSAPVAVTLDLVDSTGARRSRATQEIPARGALSSFVGELFPDSPARSTDFIRASAPAGVVPFEYLGIDDRQARGLNGQDATGGARTLYAPQFAVDRTYKSMLSLVNLDPVAATVTLRLRADDGSPLGPSVEFPLAAGGKIQVSDLPMDQGGGQGYVEITSGGPRLTGSVSFTDARQNAFATSLPLVSALGHRLLFGQIASDTTYFTGLALLNPGDADADAHVDVSNSQGVVVASDTFRLKGRGRISKLLTEYFPELSSQQLSGGYIRVESAQPLAGFALFGTHRLSVVSAIPAQQWTGP